MIGQITAYNVYVRHVDASGKLQTFGETVTKGTSIMGANQVVETDYYVGVGNSPDLPIAREEFVQIDYIDSNNAPATGWVASQYTDLDLSQPLTSKTAGSNPVPTGLAILGLVGLALIFSRNK
tara:strand:- start:77 stop:445 length:369 start_codon:yes stop_codon:yes gene_type:complete